jgi:DNA-binding transcriptional MerR regulator
MFEASSMVYTVKQLANMAGVSIRTLHFYDQVGLLKPAAHGENGYRYYSEKAALRLQQIMFFKELDFSLDEIKTIIDRPQFDLLQALNAHRAALQERARRLERLLHTVDKTIMHLEGELEMSQKQLFEGFSEEKQKQYEQEIRRRYGDKAFEGVTDWNSYTPEQKTRIKAESEAIYRDLVSAMPKGYDSPEVQAIIGRWHQHLRYFYEPSVERLQGLGHMYNEDPEFSATFRKIHPDLPPFLEQAITFYCQNL